MGALLVISLVLLLSLSARAADQPKGPRLPTPEDYPAAGPQCKNPQRLIAKSTGRAAVFRSGMVECELLIHRVCDREMQIHKSGPRETKAAVCGDYDAASKSLNGRAVCCDTASSCTDPAASSGVFSRDPFGSETPADIAPSCESCPGGTWKLNIGEISFHPTQREEPGGYSGSVREVICIIFVYACAPRIIPQCVYTYEAIWTCTQTGKVLKTTKSKIVDGFCQPRG